MQPKYSASLFLDEEDKKNKEELKKMGYSVRDTWKKGAEEILKKNNKQITT